MSVTVSKLPNIYVFAGNPVVFEFNSDTQDEIIISVKVGNNDPKYFVRYPLGTAGSYKASINISDYLQPFFKNYSVSENAIIELLENFSLEFQVFLNDELIYAGTAFRGGLPDTIFRKLAENSIDIFNYRLVARFQQFLFTTRTHRQNVRIRESELYPLSFIHPGTSIVFESGSGNTIDTEVKIMGSICTMDIKAIRKAFEQQYSEIPDLIKVYAGDYSFTVTIDKSQISEERYIARFMNSLGAYEQIELTGVAENNPTFGDENIWLSPAAYNTTVENRDRLLIRDVVELETGYKRPDELDFIQDLVTSNEVYLIFPDGWISRYHVKAEALKRLRRMITPTSFRLSFRLVNEEQYYSSRPDLDSISSSGIFDETFDETFE